MKGYIPVEIPTKKYIRAFMIAQLGPQPLMNTESVIGHKLFDVLQRTTDERKSSGGSKHYNTTIRVYISMSTFRRHGANLNVTNLKKFNGFLQVLIKDKMRFLLDIYVPMSNSFEKGLGMVREVMKIDDEDWDTDSIKKDYYRYRLKNNMPLLYNKGAHDAIPYTSC